MLEKHSSINLSLRGIRFSEVYYTPFSVSTSKSVNAD